MTLNEGIARDPPRTRRLRLLAPVLILLALLFLALVPGILIHISERAENEPAQEIERFLTYEGR